MDLTREGLLMFFKEYQVAALEALWGNNDGMSSRDSWDAVGVDSISRASIIYFLYTGVENDLLTVEYVTGKGGHRGSISPVEAKRRQKNI